MFRSARPLRLRVLFPLLVAPGNASIEGTEYDYGGGRWAWYQTLRFLTIWAALLILAHQSVAQMVVAAGLFGMALRFDYWSNSVELLAASLAVAEIPWLGGLAAGLVLGMGRETLPLLALVSPALGLGALLSTACLQKWTKTVPEWEILEDENEHGRLQVGRNLALLSSVEPNTIEIAVFAGIAGLALMSAPALTVALVVASFLFARIDEPRVLTMLIPFAARTVCQ